MVTLGGRWSQAAAARVVFLFSARTNTRGLLLLLALDGAGLELTTSCYRGFHPDSPKRAPIQLSHRTSDLSGSQFEPGRLLRVVFRKLGIPIIRNYRVSRGGLYGKTVSDPLRTPQKPQKTRKFKEVKPYPQFLTFGTGPVHANRGASYLRLTRHVS